MKPGNLKYYYLGILYFFVAKIVIDIATCLLYMMINFFTLSIWIAPIALTVICITLIYLFLFRQTMPKVIKPLIFALVLLVSIILSHLLSYDVFFVNYPKEEIALAYSFIKGLNALFMFSFGIIAYIKYYRIKEE